MTASGTVRTQWPVLQWEPLKPPRLCPSRSLRDISCPLVCTRDDIILISYWGGHCDLWVKIVSRASKKNLTSSCPCSINVKYTRESSCSQGLNSTLKAHFSLSDCTLVKPAESNDLFSTSLARLSSSVK